MVMVVLGGGFYVVLGVGCDEVCIVYVFNEYDLSCVMVVIVVGLKVY